MKFYILFLFLIFSRTLLSTDSESIPPRIFFFFSQGRINEGMELYKQLKAMHGVHDHRVLEEVCLNLLERSLKQPEPESQLLALFGASISMNDRTNPILLQGLNSSIPEIQAISINLLAKQQDDEIASALLKMVSSPYLILRLEAIYQLAQRKDPRASTQIESMIYKVDPRLTPLFPPLLGMIGTPSAISTWKKLFTHSNTDTRVSSILAAADKEQDDFLPLIRKLTHHQDIREQEACCYALGIFQDSISINRLQVLSRSSHPHVKLSALLALHKLGYKESAIEIKNLAAGGFPFAAASLESLEGSQDFLASLQNHSSPLVRLNATLSLLAQKDPRAARGLAHILIPGPHQPAFVPLFSPGKTQKIWKTVPSHDLDADKATLVNELSLQFREEVLEMSLELPLADFLELSDKLFQARQNDLMPLLTELMINLDHEQAIERWKKWKNQVGAPLIRTYALIGLVRAGQKEYVSELRRWILEQPDQSLSFRSFIPLENRIEKGDAFVLAPSENARLMMEAIEALLAYDGEEALDVLIDLMQRSTPETNVLLAGILLRTLCR